MRKENERLRRLLEEALRKIKRQTGPFSRNHPKANPKPPGRKPGDGQGKRGGHRPPKEPDEEHRAPVGEQCPDCGGHVAHTETHEQWQEDLVRQTRWRLFHVEVGQCTRCGRRVQGRHPLQTSDALGAAAVQIGPEALAFGAELSKHLGLSHEKVARLLAAVRGRIIRLLRRHDIDLAGDFDDGLSDPLALESPVLAQVQGASVLGRVATGPRAGQRVLRLGSDPTAPLVTTGGPHHAHSEGFDLYANAAVAAGERLEHLCRYICAGTFCGHLSRRMHWS